MDLRTLQDWTVRLILRTAPGVDDVTSWGGGERQYQVRIDPQRLYARGLGFGDVLNAIPANNGQVGGNVMDVGREQYLVRGLGLLSSAEDIGAIVLKAEHGVPVYLRDVATVVEAPAPRFGAVTRDGEEVVLGMALARIGENAKNVVDAVSAKLATVSAALPEGVVLKPIYQRTDLVNKAVGTATAALVEGSILVAVVLFLFLGELRSALVVIVRPAARDADCVHRHAAVRPLGQPDVARGSRDRHRHDGRRRRRHGGERVPPHGRTAGARRTGQPHLGRAGRGQGGRQPDRLCDRHHHRGVPAAVCARRTRRQALQADGVHDRVRDGRARWSCR